MTDRDTRGNRLRRFAERLKEHFPERQLVLRTEGRVRYLRLSSRAQMAAVAMLVAAGGWATFTSVNYVLHDRIVASKDSQIANTRLAYRSLLKEVAEYQRKFNAITTDLEANHNLMLGLVEQNASLQQNLKTVEVQLEATEQDRERVIHNRERLKTNLTDIKDRMRALSTKNFALKENLTSIEDELQTAMTERDKALQEGQRLKARKDELENRLAELQDMEQGAVQKLTDRTTNYIESMERVIVTSGLDVDKVLAADLGIDVGQGGPFIDANIQTDNLPAAQLKGELMSLDSRLERTAALQTVMRKLPLAAPMDTYYVTSSFGKRRDPINKRWAMHYGLDLGGPIKTPVYSPAPGVVKFAGWKNKYGKVVEIDHGAGVITRYGHLHSFTVKKGQKVEFHDKIGRLGNTGRSTGAHLHYEVTFNGKAINPWKFIKAGRHVFQE